MTTPAQLKWLPKLMGFDYEILFKKGVENVTADTLSRLQNAKLLSIVCTYNVSTDLYPQIVASWEQDLSLKSLITKLQANSNVQGHYTWANQQLRRKGKLMVGKDKQLRVFYWKKIRKEIKEFVRNCDICQRYKLNLEAYPGLLQPLPIQKTTWTSISMDFIEGIPKSQGKDVILVVVDRLSKYGHFMALSRPFTATQVAQLFLDNIYKLHGLPYDIVSDKDKVFLSLFWKELFKLLKVQLNMSTSYHPQLDGQTEVVNRSLECYLRCMTREQPNQWYKWLSLAE
ncbi:ty3-gypsy retrotransposon protein [Tanacetum coccineum]